MGDEWARALNRRPFTEAREPVENRGGDELVAPARRNDTRVPSAQTRVRKLHWRRGQCGEERVRAEHDDRHSLRYRRLGGTRSCRRESHLAVNPDERAPRTERPRKLRAGETHQQRDEMSQCQERPRHCNLMATIAGCEDGRGGNWYRTRTAH